MDKRVFWMQSTVLFLVLFGIARPSALAAEKVRMSQAFKGPSYDMIFVTAAEKGIWKQNGLDVEWLILAGTPLVFGAVMAGDIDMGLGLVPGPIGAASRGIPVISVADYAASGDWRMWVLPEGPIKELKDLKGHKVAVSRFGSPSEAYMRVFLKGLGLDKDVTIVAAGGGLSPRIAALKAGVVAGFLNTAGGLEELVVTGKVRGLGSLDSLLPSPWVRDVVWSHKGFAAKKPHVVKAVVLSVLQARDFIETNPEWTIEKMKSVFGFSQAAASEAYKENFPKAERGKINRQGVSNVRDFLIEHGLISKEKAPPVDDLFTNAFVPGG